MSDRGRVLLIAYQFCPKGRIGTRRWSKFAKYFSRAGYTVHVLAARYPYTDTVNWCADVRDQPRIHIHHIPDAYPPALLRAERSWWVKLGERLLRSSVFQLEYAQHWHRWLLPAARRLIREHAIERVIATGAPFTPFAAVAKLKEEFPDKTFLLDFRDPWSSRLGGEDTPSRKQKARAEQLEKTAMAAIDGVLFTTVEHRDHYAELHDLPMEKLHVLPNGYDPEDFAALPAVSPQPWHFVYPGAMLLNRLTVLGDWLAALEAHATEEQLAQLRVDVFSTTSVPLDRLPVASQQLVRRYVRFCEPLPPAELNRRMVGYAFGLVLNTAEHPYIVPAKTYTFMGLGLDMVYISPPTAMSERLQQAGQYVASATPAALDELAQRMVAAAPAQSAATRGAVSPSYAPFSIDNLTERLIERLSADR